LKLAKVPGSTMGRGQVFDFCNTHWFWVFENFQIQRTVARFHERTGKDLVVLGKYLVFFHFLRTAVI
jgi:hypothetical protein